MPNTSIFFSTAELNTLFPYYFIVNKNTVIEQASTAFVQAYPNCTSIVFNQYFKVVTDGASINTFPDCNLLIGTSIQLKSIVENNNSLLCNVHYINSLQCFLFVCTLLHEQSNNHIMAALTENATQTFLENISHEIRTPLNAIAGMAYLLYDTTLNTEQKEYVEIIQNSTEVLVSMVANVLDTSATAPLKSTINQQQIDIATVLKGIEKTIRIQHKNNQVALQIDYPVYAIPNIISNEWLITQLLHQLLTVSTKVITHGQVHVQVACTNKQVDAISFSVLTTVSTTNFAQANYQQLFNDVYKLVENLQGTVLVKKETQTLVINIQLPFLLAKATNNSTYLLAAKQQYSFKGSSVLIAEDNEVNRKYIGKLLHKWQVDYDFAFDGEQAIALLKSGKNYQLILMDIQMPIKDGIQATIDIRNANEWYSSIPIIGVSATAIMALQQNAIACGINTFIAKPYTPAQLQMAMAQFLQTTFEQPSAKATDSGTGIFVFNSLLDIEKLHELINDDYEYAKALFEIFESTILPQIEDVKKAFANNECELFSKLIHKIKPTFTMVGIPGVHELLNTLEVQSAATNNIGHCQNLYEDFLQQLDIYVPIVKNEKLRLAAFLNG
jgi:CheY-like chemotaxis protein/nitrogen-specific signal transduction histidine kinase/HPt (histidine-containing phosphotransfer) domain-containing protein